MSGRLDREGWGPGEREQAERLLGHAFEDVALLELAFTHPSWSGENEGGRGNERLEFLGDAVIDLVVAHRLHETHPDWDEGELSRALRTLVSNRNFARYARELGLGELVRLGRGERRSGGANRDRLLGNLFEAVVGALFLDGGLEAAERFLRGTFGEAIETEGVVPERDPKTRLQEWSSAERGVFPTYATVEDSGVEYDPARFRVEVQIDGESFGSGEGATKREAERRAAAAGLERAEGGS